MRTPKAKWKHAPLDQRRVSSERSAPKARFTRSQRSASLPASLGSGDSRRAAKPLLILGGALLLVSLGVALVIAVGSYIRAERGFEEIAWRSTYYGLPTQPFATLAPDAGQGLSAVVSATDVPIMWQSGQFPALAGADDPRWLAGTATLLVGSFDLRTAPTPNAESLQTVGETTEVAFITQFDWGVWAQVRIGETIGWVDTSTVRLEAA